MSAEADSPPPLTPDQRRAAALLAAGETGKQAAAVVDVSPKTVGRWSERDDFRGLVRKLREQMLPSTPDAEGVLVAALNATRKDGLPDWPARIAAAKALLSAPVASEEAQAAARRVERIHVAPPAEDDGAPRPFPLKGVG